MLRRHPVVVAVLVAALTPLALAAALDVAAEHPRDPLAVDVALTGPTTGLDPAVARMNPEGRLDSVASQRPLKQGLVVLAVAAAVANCARLARRRGVVHARGRQPLVGWVADHGSRSPPRFQLLIP